MEGKICLVTGATSGIGRETARALAAMGARVIVAGRNEAKVRDTAAAIARENGCSVEEAVADLSLMAEVRRLAGDLKERLSRLDVLVNNAGNVFTARRQSIEGLEQTWALNHLSPMLLTLELLPLLEEGAPSRVVNVASDAHRFGKLDFGDLQMEEHFGGLKAYANAKLANVMFTFALARLLEGRGVTVNCLHPGFVATGIGAEMSGAMRFLQNVILQPFRISTAKGAATPVHLASSKHVEGISGRYFEKCRGARPSKASRDVTAQEKLWAASMVMLDEAGSF